MSGLVFVTTDGSAKVPRSQRALIRSHCMREKNKQPQSRRSKREARRLLAAAMEGESEKASDVCSTPSASSDTASRTQLSFAQAAPVEHVKLSVAPPPDWALIRFPLEMDRTSQMHFHRFFRCNPIRDPVFPFKLFGIKVDVHTDDLWLSATLTQDELFFRTIDLMMASSNDLIYGCGLTNRARRKMTELLPMLNQRLAQPDSHKEGVVLYVVGILASMATLFGDYASASVHSKGVSRILQLRGRSEDHIHDLMLVLGLDRLSFASSLLTDQWTPILAEATLQRDLEFDEETIGLHRAQGMVRSDCVPDSRLALVFYTLQCTTILLDTHDFGAPTVNGSRLHKGMSFVQSELLRLKDLLMDGLSEVIRLSMVAFLTTTFRVPGQYEHPACARLAKPLLASCTANGDGIAILPGAMRTWLLLVGVMTASGFDHLQIRMAWRDLVPLSPALSWEAVRGEAKKVMWIDAIHDALGRRAFDALCLLGS